MEVGAKDALRNMEAMSQRRPTKSSKDAHDQAGAGKTETPKSARQQETARKIVRSALKLFLRDGFAETSMDAIARESRASKASIYSRFASKNELFRAVLLEVCHDADAEAASTQDAAPTDDVRSALNFAGLAAAARFSMSETGLLLERVIAAKTSEPDAAKLFWAYGPADAVRYVAEALHRAGVDGDPFALAEDFMLDICGPVVARGVFDLSPPGGELSAYVAARVDAFLARCDLAPD